jgi:hypothetical protein
MERYAQRSFANYLIPSGNWDVAKIKLLGQNETIEIDHKAKDYEVRPGVYGGLTVWDRNDPECAHMATAFALSGLRRIGEVFIAGVRSIEYTGKRSSTRRITVALAPSLGCTQMREIDRDFNSLGLPTSFNHSEVVSFQIGEPDPALFQIPKDYNQRTKR